MEQGLAQQMVYGSGSSQTVKHHYSGTLTPTKAKKAVKGKKKNCKK